MRELEVRSPSYPFAAIEPDGAKLGQITSRNQAIARALEILQRLSEQLHKEGLAQPSVRPHELAAILLAERRARGSQLSAELFGEPGWDMLLDLVVQAHKGTQVSTSSLTLASAVPTTTALRWIAYLETQGLIDRKPDVHDGRRSNVELTPLGYSTMLTELRAQAELRGVTLVVDDGTLG